MAQKEISAYSSARHEIIQLVPADPEKILEGEIWQNFKDGEEKAFIWIYKTYFDTLYNYGRQFDLDTEFVKDQIQDLFIYIRNNRKQLADVKSIKFYLFKSLRKKITVSKEAKIFIYFIFSWKDNIIHFNHSDFDQVIGSLQRWYGVDFVFVGQKSFEGLFSAIYDYDPLVLVLEGLKDQYDFNYKIKGDKVIIK
jgi:hypothetical protein